MSPPGSSAGRPAQPQVSVGSPRKSGQAGGGQPQGETAPTPNSGPSFPTTCHAPSQPADPGLTDTEHTKPKITPHRATCCAHRKAQLRQTQLQSRFKNTQNTQTQFRPPPGRPASAHGCSQVRGEGGDRGSGGAGDNSALCIDVLPPHPQSLREELGSPPSRAPPSSQGPGLHSPNTCARAGRAPAWFSPMRLDACLKGLFLQTNPNLWPICIFQAQSP